MEIMCKSVTLHIYIYLFIIIHNHIFQLCHSLINKYVRVNSTLTSRTENTSLFVELSSENSSSCVFKILPRYKVRSVGDVVRQ